ncbi:acetylornithine deacetylase [Endobacter medicaginis]|uniref:Acetylornithine deacetylase n=2 Tax=Endobacter medicaginis TaxID=1181271 RepID=A0A839V4Q7_9PROT|nr:acetylornithine deacetylase [Endobacter medicaginis]MBB3174451.1 acetylornithine deacetylase [Endobacter medicaginis]MCX5475100.1 acetylornithine deacetylase [Endobacter medicaginis]
MAAHVYSIAMPAPHSAPSLDAHTTREILDRLVSFDTTSRNPNRDLIDWIAAWLLQRGVEAEILPDAGGGKANLHAVIGPRGPGGLALSGHVDTVPVDGQAWSSDPFTLREANGRLHARGAVDMKGFVASALACVPDLLERRLHRPVHLFVTYDEEVNCAGATALVAHLDATGDKPDWCVVGEPSGMKPIVAHKGRLSLRVRVRGKAGHSSQPEFGANAIHAAARAVARVADEQDRLAREGVRVDGFDPPFSTTHVGTISGGAILNIIPESAEFDMEWRTVPGDDALAELTRLQDHVARHIEPALKAGGGSGFVYEILNELPPLSLPPGHALAQSVRHASGHNAEGRVSYGTEAGIYQNAGIATIVCGPGHIAQAHQPDEWIAVSELEACDVFLRRLVDSTVARA